VGVVVGTGGIVGSEKMVGTGVKVGGLVVGTGVVGSGAVVGAAVVCTEVVVGTGVFMGEVVGESLVGAGVVAIMVKSMGVTPACSQVAWSPSKGPQEPAQQTKCVPSGL
jgi:hypothetical protein